MINYELLGEDDILMLDGINITCDELLALRHNENVKDIVCRGKSKWRGDMMLYDVTLRKYKIEIYV